MVFIVFPSYKKLAAKSRIKMLLIAFFNSNGLIRHEFAPTGKTSNAELYEGVLKWLLQCIRQIECIKSGQWNLLHNNGSPHTVICMSNFLVKYKATVLEHPPYFPDLASAGFLFPHLKGVLKGLCFADVAEIQQCVTLVTQVISKEAFAGSFQQLYNRNQKCVVANGDYFECQ